MEDWTAIRGLHARGMSIRAIARKLGIARNTVRSALAQTHTPRYQRPTRPNAKLASFDEQIQTWYFTDGLIGSRILRELRARGYSGSASALYARLQALRASRPATDPSAKATVRFETAPGHQAQFDWSPYTVEIGGQLTRVIVFGMTLGYSRRKHYTANLNETQPAIFDAIEHCLRHFGGAPKELLVDNARALVSSASPARFHWNAQFLELCGHYRVTPRACQPYRARTKGKVERPFFYLEQHFIKGRRFASFADLLADLATFERDDLDVRVHSTTGQRPIDRFAEEAALLTPLPAQRFVGSQALTRKASWDCMISFRGSRYSVPSSYAGKHVWLLVLQGTRLIVLDHGRQTIAEHPLAERPGQVLTQPEHYAALQRRGARTLALLSQEFTRAFPEQAGLLDRLTAQYKQNAAAHLRTILELAALYDAAAMVHAFEQATHYNTYSGPFIRGILQASQQPKASLPAVGGGTDGRLGSHAGVRVETDLGRYQRTLEAAQ
ncbi:MAG: IS21 family transposase [Chloroflexota bacterium]